MCYHVRGYLLSFIVKEGIDTKRLSTFKTILTALFAALICVATMLVQIPIPSTGGYANLGDGIILVCAFLIHPACAVAAAGIGSMLADLLAGYIAYAPGTLIIKAGVALIASLVWNHQPQKGKKPVSVGLLLAASVLAECFMVLGYFCYEAFFLGVGMGAAAAVLGNIGQAAVGVIIACIAAPVLLRSDELRTWMDKTRK